MTRRSRGVFGTIVHPVTGLVGTVGNLAGSVLDYGVGIPTSALLGVKNVTRNAVKGVAHGVQHLGDRAAHGLNSSLGSAFSRKSRKNSRRNSRKNSRR